MQTLYSPSASWISYGSLFDDWSDHRLPVPSASPTILPRLQTPDDFSQVSFSSESIKGKVVLIAGASSGIGEHRAYEYAKRRACLVIVARRENLLREVAEKARKLGSPDVVPICADVLMVDEDCKRFVEEAVDHIGRSLTFARTIESNNVKLPATVSINLFAVDHLVNNAGISSMCLIEDATDITRFQPVMDVNFWGSIYPTNFAMPYLKRTKGSISVNASASAYMHPSGFSIYTASKAALVSFYETMRSEMPPEISITIATLSLVESEMTKGKHLNREGTTETLINQLPAMSTSACAKSIVEAVCRKERYVTEPKWCAVLFLLKAPCPGLIEFVNCRLHLRVKASVAKNFSMPPPENRSA